jgi:hypothetical protein
MTRERKYLTGRTSAARYAVCMWREVAGGVDVLLVPEDQGLRLTMEVRLRITEVGVRREESVGSGRIGVGSEDDGEGSRDGSDGNGGNGGGEGSGGGD